MRSDKYKATSGKSLKIGKRELALTPKNIIKIILLVILALIVAMVIYAVVCIATAPKIDTSKIYETLSEASVIYDQNGKKVDTVYSDQNRVNVKYDDLPENLVNAFVALEDKTFWKHHGFNFIRVMGAIKSSITSGGQVSGTSTITQQLARNVYLTSSMSQHTMKRKIIEAWYTVKLERNLSKKQIMEAYLNTINLGFGSYGVEAASEAYFGKHVQKLTLAQCAALAALPQAPSNYALVELLDSDATPSSGTVLKRNSEGTYVMNDTSKDRRDTCLALMKEQGYITSAQYKKATGTSLKKMLHVNFNANSSGIAYFTDYVVEQVISDLQDKQDLSYDDAWDKVYKGGLKIYSTLDLKAQKTIQKEFRNDANFPSITNISYDGNGNILNKNGVVAMYKYSNYISNGRFTFKSGEITKNSDNSLTIKANRRLNVYKTTANGQTDYSIEFPTMYQWANGKLYAISGGYINIPQQYKTLDSKGNVIVSAKFVTSKAGKKFFHKKNGRYYITKDGYTVNQKVVQPQAAMTIIENSTGEIKAMVGGRKTRGKMLYNRATEPRQSGSSIKPLAVYGAALQQSVEEMREGKKHTFVNYNIDSQGTSGWGDYITAGSTVVDERTTNNGTTWPANASGSYSGRQTFRSALRNSINTCAYKIFMQVGVDYSVKMVKKFGITTLVTTGSTNDLNAAALALGGQTKGVTTLEMANAFTTFPNNGTRAKTPICYTKVTDGDGNTLITKTTSKVRVLDKGVAWIMTNLLKGVVSGGTGTAAAVTGTQAGGKTGTTSNQYDIWFDGFTQNYTGALWIGNDINISLTSMSGYAASLWGKIMNQLPEAVKGSYKGMPGDVQYVNGEYYVKGTYSYSGYSTGRSTTGNNTGNDNDDNKKAQNNNGNNNNNNNTPANNGNNNTNNGNNTDDDDDE